MVGIIDCGLHETLASTGDLVAYLDDVWRAYRPQIPTDPYRIPASAGGSPYRQASYDEVRDKHLDPHGVELAVLAGALFPGSAFTQVEYHLALTSAYNSWLADQWLERDERFAGSVQVCLARPEWSAQEIERCAQNPRIVQVVLPATGEDFLGLPRYRPIFETAARHGLAVALAPAPSTRTATGHPASYTEWRAGMQQTFMTQLMNLIVSGVFDEQPGLRVLLLGCGFAWLPYLMWTMDSNYKALRAEVPWLQRKPSEYVAGHVFVGTHPYPDVTPRQVEQLVDMVGADVLVYASDFPHRGWDAPQDMCTPAMRETALRLYGPRLAKATR